MKTLRFTHAGTDYSFSLAPNTFGHVTRYGEHRFALPHPSWRIVGFSRHHWSNHAAFPTADSLRKNPAQINGAFVWDSDHGTIRSWRGRSGGKLARVQSAHISAEGCA